MVSGLGGEVVRVRSIDPFWASVRGASSELPQVETANQWESDSLQWMWLQCVDQQTAGSSWAAGEDRLAAG